MLRRAEARVSSQPLQPAHVSPFSFSPSSEPPPAAPAPRPPPSAASRFVRFAGANRAPAGDRYVAYARRSSPPEVERFRSWKTRSRKASGSGPARGPSEAAGTVAAKPRESREVAVSREGLAWLGRFPGVPALRRLDEPANGSADRAGLARLRVRYAPFSSFAARPPPPSTLPPSPADQKWARCRRTVAIRPPARSSFLFFSFFLYSLPFFIPSIAGSHSI